MNLRMVSLIQLVTLIHKLINPPITRFICFVYPDCKDGTTFCVHLLTILSVLMVIVCLPFSLLCVVKVVQEYERAVIFRLGRLLSGGARGPGVFFVIPCVDLYEKIDLRTNTYEIPTQEVNKRN